LELGYSKNGEAPEVRWDDFKAFEAIAKTSSIKKAAAALGTTQSALSKRLARLEQSLGVRLIDRGPKGATLTYPGERVLSRVVSADRELSRATQEAQLAESRIEGDCSILIGDGIANYWLAQFMPIFFDHYPRIELKVFLEHDLGAAKNHVFDIRLHYYEPIDPAQVMRPLATIHFVPFASRAYLEKFGLPSAADLTAHRVADQLQHLISKGSWPSWFGDEMANHTSLFTNQSAFLGKCVHEGVGIALMPTYMAIGDETLVALDLGVTLPSRLFASYNRERAQTQPVKTMLSFLRTAVFDPPSMPWFDEQFQFPQADWSERLRACKKLLAKSRTPG
jgi:DNA-binding transcriptional LysR family regulator